MPELDIHKVLALLPQRFPFLMIDRVLECEPGKRIRALKNVSANEPYFPGHFPNRPVMPGVLILEAMAQAAAILVFHSQGSQPDKNSVYYYAGIDNARFKRPVSPGDQLELEVAILGSKRGVWKFGCTAHVGAVVAAEADILCTVRAVDGA
ncbi:MAG TPA: 3-hydroxyacyl-ACP dehydratase FabZ [Burkholderiales bacterium]|jgi:3-hydroxyacyl-[acyl-carrier-protein] dehydratase|nr:3-hydroxyacyl-ACP dehydratase FabZ [Burkholderiales bacterium]